MNEIDDCSSSQYLSLIIPKLSDVFIRCFVLGAEFCPKALNVYDLMANESRIVLLQYVTVKWF